MKLNRIRSAPVAIEAQNNEVAWIYRPVLEFLILEAASKAPLETGGILMGYFGEPGNVPVILSAAGPGPKAVHLRDYYRPDPVFDEAQIATVYERSSGRITYLGDWHTHLTPFGGLSYRDERTLHRIARHKSARIKTPLMLVLSYDGKWDVTIWQGCKAPKSRLWRRGLAVAELSSRVFSANCFDPALNQIQWPKRF